jgi:hypothetical protein
MMAVQAHSTATVIREQLLEGCEAMAGYALAGGLIVPESVTHTLTHITNTTNPEGDDHKDLMKLSAEDIALLNKAHNVLSTLVAPAQPGSILLLAREAKKVHFWSFLGKAPLIRRLMLVAFVFLVMFVSLSLSKSVDLKSGDIFESSGIPLLLNLGFFISSAGLGACFAALFQANYYIVKGTFDPKYEPSYWIRIFLGIIAGILLAELIPIDMGEESVSLGRPTLAMLGGFSSALVYRLLNRLVEAVESLVRGSAKEQVEAKTEKVRVKVQEEANLAQVDTGMRLIRIKKAIAGGATTEETEKMIDQWLEEIAPGK